MLGDNAYESGFDSDYQGGVFEAYPQILAKHSSMASARKS
jgi:hypothetical protein